MQLKKLFFVCASGLVLWAGSASGMDVMGQGRLLIKEMREAETLKQLQDTLDKFEANLLPVIPVKDRGMVRASFMKRFYKNAGRLLDDEPFVDRAISRVMMGDDPYQLKKDAQKARDLLEGLIRYVPKRKKEFESKLELLEDLYSKKKQVLSPAQDIEKAAKAKFDQTITRLAKQIKSAKTVEEIKKYHDKAKTLQDVFIDRFPGSAVETQQMEENFDRMVDWETKNLEIGALIRDLQSSNDPTDIEMYSVRIRNLLDYLDTIFPEKRTETNLLKQRFKQGSALKEKPIMYQGPTTYQPAQQQQGPPRQLSIDEQNEYLNRWQNEYIKKLDQVLREGVNEGENSVWAGKQKVKLDFEMKANVQKYITDPNIRNIEKKYQERRQEKYFELMQKYRYW